VAGVVTGHVAADGVVDAGRDVGASVELELAAVAVAVEHRRADAAPGGGGSASQLRLMVRMAEQRTRPTVL
jgi:hypothetical protein